MRLFVRNIDGSLTSIDATSPLDLYSQITSLTSLPSSSFRLSHSSRTIPAQSTTFDDYRIQPNSTISIDLRLRGGGPKKRCAHVFVPKSASTTPVGSAGVSGTNTPVTGTEGKEKNSEPKEKEEQDKDVAEEVKKVEETAIPTIAQEPIMERCSSAALRMIGDCPRCSKSFCGAHRLPEDHACPALDGFRKAAFDENRKRLVKEATTGSKISAF